MRRVSHLDDRRARRIAGTDREDDGSLTLADDTYWTTNTLGDCAQPKLRLPQLNPHTRSPDRRSTRAVSPPHIREHPTERRGADREQSLGDLVGDVTSGASPLSHRWAP